jgi:hypothetical protein
MNRFSVAARSPLIDFISFRSRASNSFRSSTIVDLSAMECRTYCNHGQPRCPFYSLRFATMFVSSRDCGSTPVCSSPQSTQTSLPSLVYRVRSTGAINLPPPRDRTGPSNFHNNRIISFVKTALFHAVIHALGNHQTPHNQGQAPTPPLPSKIPDPSGRGLRCTMKTIYPKWHRVLI